MTKIRSVEILKKCQKLLSLENENIKLKYYLESDPSAQAVQLTRNEEEEYWVVEYIDEGIEFLLMHEIGHIYFYKFIKNIHFSKQVTQEVNREFFNYNNVIVDCFVNYHITRFDYIYSEYIKYINKLIIPLRFGVKPDTPQLLGHYINIYLELNYCLKKNELILNKKIIKKGLSKYKQLIIKHPDYNLFNKDFIRIERKLDEFDKIKHSKNSKIIIDYIHQVLRHLSKWDNAECKTQLKIIYNL